MTTFLLNEIYPCLQGEGVNLGVPSLLVRFQICNLRCSWCDTPYTHTVKSDLGRSPKRYSLEDLVLKIESFGINHLILSGGEPTLQPLGVLMRTLLARGVFTAEVESNGTQIPHLNLPSFHEDDYHLMQWNISPKFENAGESIHPQALAHWSLLAQKHPKVFFKFVIRSGDFFQKDVEGVLKIIQRYDIPKNRVLLMPEGTGVESQIHQGPLHDVCLHHGFRYTPRLHVLIFGAQRGV